MNEKVKNINERPASYPKTSAVEQESKNIFQSLLDTKFVRGELRVMDKYPNTDGILDITDEDGVPIGKVDIQLKTLSPKNYSKPRFQCDKRFFAYCANSPLPVILVVINIKEKTAYWRHIDRETLEEVSREIKSNSYSLLIPQKNCIDRENRHYIGKRNTAVLLPKNMLHARNNTMKSKN